jgi:hypothetical protein
MKRDRSNDNLARKIRNRLNRDNRMSYAKIASELGCNLSTVKTIAESEAGLYSVPCEPYDCPGCGGRKVILRPCIACQAIAYKKARGMAI